MKEQLGLSITGFEPNVATTFMQQCCFQNLQANHVLVRLTWLSHLREDQWASCPPECQCGPSLFFCHLFQLLIYTTTFLLLLAVYSCVTSLGIYSHAWARVQNQRVFVCVCAFLLLAQLDNILVLHVIPGDNFVGSCWCKTIHSSTYLSLSIQNDSPVCPRSCWHQTAGRLDLRIHINEAVKSFIHQLIYIAEHRGPKSKGFQNTLQDLQIRWDKLFISLACCSFQP